LVRQRPGTAKGTVFLTLEDETGVANIIVWPKVFEALRAVVIGSKLIAVTGRLQREGEVVHIVAEKAEDWTRALSQLSVMGPDLQAIARADEIKQPLPGRREPVLTRPPELFDAMPLPGLPEHQDARRAMPKGRNFQ
jgi:error-prone DNA polymerase